MYRFPNSRFCPQDGPLRSNGTEKYATNQSSRTWHVTIGSVSVVPQRPSLRRKKSGGIPKDTSLLALDQERSNGNRDAGDLPFGDAIQAYLRRTTDTIARRHPAGDTPRNSCGCKRQENTESGTILVIRTHQQIASEIIICFRSASLGLLRSSAITESVPDSLVRAKAAHFSFGHFLLVRRNAIVRPFS